MRLQSHGWRKCGWRDGPLGGTGPDRARCSRAIGGPRKKMVPRPLCDKLVRHGRESHSSTRRPHVPERSSRETAPGVILGENVR